MPDKAGTSYGCAGMRSGPGLQRRSRVNLVRIQMVSEFLGQKHILDDEDEAERAIGRL